MHTCVTMYYNEFLIYFALLKLEIKISRTTALEFQDFPGFSRTCVFFQDFQAWKSQQLNSRTFQDFPGSVRTLVYILVVCRDKAYATFHQKIGDVAQIRVGFLLALFYR